MATLLKCDILLININSLSIGPFLQCPVSCTIEKTQNQQNCFNTRNLYFLFDETTLASISFNGECCCVPREQARSTYTHVGGACCKACRSVDGCTTTQNLNASGTAAAAHCQD